MIDMVEIQEMNYSYSALKSSEMSIKHSVINALSVYLPGYKFMPLVKAGIFDGKKKFYRVAPNGSIIFPTGLTNLVKKTLNLSETEFECTSIETEKVHITDEEADQFIKECNMPFELYDYQRQSLIDCINKRRQICVMATGSGKSATIALLFEYYRRLSKKCVLIVPNINLLEQFSNDILEYNLHELKENVHLIGGDNKIKHFDAACTITTWQSLSRSAELFQDIDVILIDEAHGIKASVLSELILDSIDTPVKLGFTGTLPEHMIDKMTLIGTIGSHKEYITAKELIDGGLGTPIKVNALFLNYNDESKAKVKKMKYQDEVKYLEELPERNQYISKLTKKMREMVGNTLVLYTHTSHGEHLWELITNSPPGTLKKIKNKFEAQKAYGVFFISGSVNGKQREEVRNVLEEFSDAVLVANYSILSTGVNVKKLHAMILTSSSKSEIRIRQSVGRGIRLHDTKSVFNVYDLVDDLTYKTKTGTEYPNYMMRHWESRLGIYEAQRFDIAIREVQLQKLDTVHTL